MAEFTHFDKEGKALMVDVSDKEITERTATAAGSVLMAPETVARILAGGVAKGDVLSVARLAGIMGAKRTPDLIPLCHPLNIGSVAVELTLDRARPAVDIVATVKVNDRTGVEMEALTAVAVAALTRYALADLPHGLGLIELRAWITRANLPSVRIAQRLGYARSADSRSQLQTGDRWEMPYLYARRAGIDPSAV